MKISITILAIVLSICAIYQFIIRPIQQDNKLDSCLDSMWSLYGDNDELYQAKTQSCYQEFK